MKIYQKILVLLAIILFAVNGFLYLTNSEIIANPNWMLFIYFNFIYCGGILGWLIVKRN